MRHPGPRAECRVPRCKDHGISAQDLIKETFIIDTFIPGTGAYPALNYTGSFTIRVTDRIRANVIVNILNQLTMQGYPLDTLFKVRDNMQGL